MRTALVAILASSLLLGCGGGGGSSTPPAPALVSINTTNQDAVGRATAAAGTTLIGVGGGVTPNASSASTTPAPTALAAPGSHSLSTFAHRIADVLADSNSGRRRALNATALTSAPPITIPIATVPCSISGSLEISYLDNDGNVILSVGDTLILAFNQCRDTPTETVNGSLAITLNQIDLANDLLSFSGSLAIQQMSVVQGTRTTVTNGTITMSYAEHSATETQILLVVGADGLGTTVSGAGYSDSVGFEAGFTMNQTETTGSLNFTSVSLSGGFSATSIGGRVMLETPVAIIQFGDEAYPRAGTMRVVGNGSALRIQALDTSTVHLDLDTNLDGNYEVGKDLAWAALLPG